MFKVVQICFSYEFFNGRRQLIYFICSLQYYFSFCLSLLLFSSWDSAFSVMFLFKSLLQIIRSNSACNMDFKPNTLLIFLHKPYWPVKCYWNVKFRLKSTLKSNKQTKRNPKTKEASKRKTKTAHKSRRINYFNAISRILWFEFNQPISFWKQE